MTITPLPCTVFVITILAAAAALVSTVLQNHHKSNSRGRGYTRGINISNSHLQKPRKRERLLPMSFGLPAVNLSMKGQLFDCGNIYVRAKHRNKTGRPCSVCARPFQTRQLLTVHMRTHTKERPYNCSVCSKAFSDNANFKRHLGLHLGIRPYRCPHCEKRFRLKNQLGAHMRIHTGEKPYRCTFPNCNMTFSEMTNRNAHVRLHQKIKPFACEQCNASYTVKCNLKKHVESHKNFSYICSWCKIRFQSLESGRTHARVAHGISDPLRRRKLICDLNEENSRDHAPKIPMDPS
mmetsp:Transcript_14338/g.34958  ORF Transcript_14338/g.34958 Transcript_14338/m.34958 type:complete len:293 (-) Transcript_14338:182-1060(-)